ncbi:hypothetical protein COOONC_23446, partial [Cooperia oncophora]
MVNRIVCVRVRKFLSRSLFRLTRTKLVVHQCPIVRHSSSLNTSHVRVRLLSLLVRVCRQIVRMKRFWSPSLVASNPPRHHASANLLPPL